MFGIPILCHKDVFCDNEYVFNNTSFADSTLKKKNNSIFLHSVRELVAAGIIIFHQVHTNYNLVEILTKSLSAEDRVRVRSIFIIDVVSF